MNESQPLDVADRAILLSADTMGHDFLAAMIAELRQMPDHWARLNQDLQQKTIERLKEKIRAGTEKALMLFMRGEFPAVQAEVHGVAVGAKITATLHVQREALHRHALSDATGRKVLVVIADASHWTKRMDEVKAQVDQMDLLEQTHDPFIDQAGFKPENDRMARGKSWDDLKKDLGVVDKPAANHPEPEAPSAAPADVPETKILDSDLSPEKLRAASIYGLLEKLASLGVTTSFGALKVRVDDELKHLEEWVAAYAANPGSCAIVRPEWLPGQSSEPPATEGDDHAQTD